MSDALCTDPESIRRFCQQSPHLFPEVHDLLLAAAAQMEQLRTALAGLESMYAATWDRVDGALVMMPPSVARFEAAHKEARRVLGIPLVEIDDNE